jgi:hypothetical protein
MIGIMRLSTLYDKLSSPEREALATAAGIKAPYLYQLATRWQGKKPSFKTMANLAKADKRLKLADMVAEFSEPPSEKVDA